MNKLTKYAIVSRFYSLWDTGYAKIHIPIIASVSEHQPTTWFSFFFDLHILVATFPAGLWYVIKNINDERVFSKSTWFFAFCYKANVTFHLISSCSLRLERRLFCRCDGTFDADFDTSGLHAERCCLFWFVGTLLARRYRYAETGRKRRGRTIYAKQENVRQGIYSCFFKFQLRANQTSFFGKNNE